jgi:hypothetical protein
LLLHIYFISVPGCNACTNHFMQVFGVVGVYLIPSNSNRQRK